MLTDAAGSGGSGAGAEVIEAFKGLSDEGRRDHIQALLVKIVTSVMQMEEPSFALSQPLHEVGMDSIMGLEIAASLERAIGLRLNALDLAVGPSIEQLAQTIIDRLTNSAPEERAA